LELLNLTILFPFIALVTKLFLLVKVDNELEWLSVTFSS